MKIGIPDGKYHELINAKKKCICIGLACIKPKSVGCGIIGWCSFVFNALLIFEVVNKGHMILKESGTSKWKIFLK